MRRERKLIRKKDYDYNQIGSYFITICTKEREDYFGNIKDNNMKLSMIGKIANDCWLELINHFEYIQLDEFVVMPNHIHGIVNIVGDGNEFERNESVKSVGKEYILSLRENTNKIINRMNQRLPVIIRTYKSAVSRFARKLNRTFKWQTSYHDRIIRNQSELNKIRAYIFNNPLQWKQDSFNPVRVIKNAA